MRPPNARHAVDRAQRISHRCEAPDTGLFQAPDNHASPGARVNDPAKTVAWVRSKDRSMRCVGLQRAPKDDLVRSGGPFALAEEPVRGHQPRVIDSNHFHQ